MTAAENRIDLPDEVVAEPPAPISTGDPWLARIVAAGLILLAAVALAGSVLLRSRGVEAPEITGVAAGAVGALASFFAGVALGTSRAR